MGVDQPGGVGRDAVGDGTSATTKRWWTDSLVLGGVVGAIIVVCLGGLAGWLGYRAYALHRAADERQLLLEAGRQEAVNLTTIDYQHADTDIKRIKDGATGSFYDDFAQRAEPFVELVKQTQTVTVGTVTEAGIESESADTAQVLVAVAVTTTNGTAPAGQQRSFRMRLSVQRIGDQAKVSGVEFVP